MPSTLPLLPGCSTDANLGKTNFRRSQSLEQRNGVMMVEKPKPIGGEPPSPTKPRPRQSWTGQGADMPDWYTFRNKVLRFNAYFQEAVVESNREQYRVRECTILFYLEDDSVQINEKVTLNSGIPQGTLVRRGRVLRSGELIGTLDEVTERDTDDYFNIMDFNVGAEVTIYGRTFKINDCDAFTRSYLTGTMGVAVGDKSDVPADPHQEALKQEAAHQTPGRPYARDDTLRQFLTHDRQVLRFYCMWDDTESAFGDKRYMILHYYLTDDTIEITEVLPPNSGRDKVGAFFGRNKLVKDVKALSKFPGATARRTVLNTLGPAVGDNRFILDCAKGKEISDEYYTDADFQIGNKILVLSRPMLICDCDDFTKEHYKAKFGLSDFTPIDISEVEIPKDTPSVPPPTGFGSEEDSMVSVERLVLTAPKKKLGKYMPKDSTAVGGSFILRFLASMASEDPVSKAREFVVSYFLEDDTVSVYEMPKPNSGITPGMFLQRGKYKLPDGTAVDAAAHLKIGQKLTINGFTYVLNESDAYARKMLSQIRQD